MIYSIICTRSEDPSSDTPTLKELREYFGEDETFVIRGAKSIWEGYTSGVGEILKEASPNDIIVFCHDDIEILNPYPRFSKILAETTARFSGFIGVAGTSKLPMDGVWWSSRAVGEALGAVFHGGKFILGNEGHLTYFGPYGVAEVMDGLFLATKVETLKKFDLISKPDYLEGDWNFYDLHMTMTAASKGLLNYVAPILVRHESAGELVGRKEWHIDRVNFTKKWFPITL